MLTDPDLHALLNRNIVSWTTPSLLRAEPFKQPNIVIFMFRFAHAPTMSPTCANRHVAFSKPNCMLASRQCSRHLHRLTQVVRCSSQA